MRYNGALSTLICNDYDIETTNCQAGFAANATIRDKPIISVLLSDALRHSDENTVLLQYGDVAIA
jgi:hypothetical protein